MSPSKLKRISKKNRSRKSGRALLIIDVINDLEFEGGEKVLPWAKKLISTLKTFKTQARKHGMPVIYVNDNYGIWLGSFEDVFKYCSRKGVRGASVVKSLKPSKDDYNIIKPRHSAFYYTSLIPLLEHLKAKHLILTGMATNLCVMFTAHDAHMNKYKLTVLSDCCAAENDKVHNDALFHLSRYCNATICKASEYKW